MDLMYVYVFYCQMEDLERKKYLMNNSSSMLFNNKNKDTGIPLLSLKLQISRLFEQGVLRIQATIECKVPLKRVRDMMITCS